MRFRERRGAARAHGAGPASSSPRQRAASATAAPRACRTAGRRSPASRETRARRGEHLLRGVHPDHPGDVGRECGEHGAGAAAEVGHRPLVEGVSPRSACEDKCIAEQLVAEPIPLPAAVAKNSREVRLRSASTALEPPHVLIGAGPARQLLAGQPARSARVPRPRGWPGRSTGSCHRGATSPARRRPASSAAGSPSTAATAGRCRARTPSAPADREARASGCASGPPAPRANRAGAGAVAGIYP